MRLLAPEMLDCGEVANVTDLALTLLLDGAQDNSISRFRFMDSILKVLLVWVSDFSSSGDEDWFGSSNVESTQQSKQALTHSIENPGH
jgi:hypothetical protein